MSSPYLSSPEYTQVSQRASNKHLVAAKSNALVYPMTNCDYIENGPILTPHWLQSQHLLTEHFKILLHFTNNQIIQSIKLNGKTTLSEEQPWMIKGNSKRLLKFYINIGLGIKV